MGGEKYVFYSFFYVLHVMKYMFYLVSIHTSTNQVKLHYQGVKTILKSKHSYSAILQSNYQENLFL